MWGLGSFDLDEFEVGWPQHGAFDLVAIVQAIK
jgi:hypothetical protein